ERERERTFVSRKSLCVLSFGGIRSLNSDESHFFSFRSKSVWIIPMPLRGRTDGCKSRFFLRGIFCMTRPNGSNVQTQVEKTA
ncbi:hypothetical protein TSAR_014283, partial [Trichomalopsis sarcophagae]